MSNVDCDEKWVETEGDAEPEGEGDGKGEAI